MVSILNLALSMFAVVTPRLPLAFGDSVSTSVSIDGAARFNDFNHWPVEKRIAEASVIAITTHRIEAGKLTSSISEILKSTPGTVFRFKVGDKYLPGSRFVRESVAEKVVF
jgi:hypothetical protein